MSGQQVQTQPDSKEVRDSWVEGGGGGDGGGDTSALKNQGLSIMGG